MRKDERGRYRCVTQFVPHGAEFDFLRKRMGYTGTPHPVRRRLTLLLSQCVMVAPYPTALKHRLLPGHRSQQTTHDVLQGILPGTVGRRCYDPEYITFESRLPRDDTAAVMGKAGQFFRQSGARC